MPQTKVGIVETPHEALPFKVVVSSGRKVLAEQTVTSRQAAEELVATLRPALEGFEVPDV